MGSSLKKNLIAIQKFDSKLFVKTLSISTLICVNEVRIGSNTIANELSLEERKEPRHSSKLVILHDGKFPRQLPRSLLFSLNYIHFIEKCCVVK